MRARARTPLTRSLARVVSVALIVAVGVAHASASVTPTSIKGNPSCSDLGHTYGFKVDKGGIAAAGTWQQGTDGTSGPLPPGASVTVTTLDGLFFDWLVSDFGTGGGMDAVIVKGGRNANIYVYDPPTEATQDTDLSATINAGSQQPFGISHIEFCWDFNLQPAPSLTVTKVATIISDPLGLSSYHVPGTVVRYTVTVTNNGDASPDDNSLDVADVLPPEMAMFVGAGCSDAIKFSSNSSGLSFDCSTDLMFYGDPAYPGGYDPYHGPDQYDGNITGVRLTPSGIMNTHGASFSFTLHMRVQ